MKILSTMTFFLFLFICKVVIFVYCDSQANWPKLFERNRRPLTVDGSWSSWQDWSACYNNTKDEENFYPPWENFIVQSRNRSCSSPKPLYGGKDCTPPSVRFRQCSCMNPLGLGTNRVNDSQISSSSSLVGFPETQVRLNDGYSGWCASSKLSFFKKTFIQLDFDNFASVGAVATLGNDEGRIMRYKLEFSLNGRIWQTIYQDKRKTNPIFRGNLLRHEVQKNSFNSHEVMKYLRLIPTETSVLPCLKLEVYGCIFTCGMLLTSSFGNIVARSSPDFDQNCLWRIEVLNTTSLTFDFNVFYVLCEEGYLDFHDGQFPFTEAPLIARVCLSNEDQELSILKLPSNKVWVNFVSNSSSSEVGFNIRYFSECIQVIQLIEGEQYTITSPSYPEHYLDNLKCHWTVLSPNTTNKIQFLTNDFSVESNENATSPCVDDVLVIEKQSSSVRQRVGSYCNNHVPPGNMIISAERLYVSFVSDSVASEKGFSFTLLSGTKKVISTTEKVFTENVFTEKNIPITKPGLTTKRRFKKPMTPVGRGNSTYKEQIEDDDDDDTWTIIIICVFSAFALLLLCVVVGMNIRRFISNKNDLEAHCAKIRAEEKKKEKHEKIQKLKNENESESLIVKQRSPLQEPCNIECEALTKPLQEDSEINDNDQPPAINSPDAIQPHDSTENFDHTELDGDLERSSYDSSSPQIHSPLKREVRLSENEEDETIV